MIQRIYPAIAIASLVLAWCYPASEPSTSTSEVALTGKPAQGELLAEALCSGCHAIEAGAPSPNPHAPQFEAIVNKRDLTEETLAAFLRDSHSYPEQMNFEVAVEDSEALAAYMITLKSDDYRPPVQ